MISTTFALAVFAAVLGAAPCNLPGTAADAWVAIRGSAPCPGVAESEQWVFSCVRRPRDPDIDEPMDHRMAEQEALQQMLAARLGRLAIPDSVPVGVRALLEPVFRSDIRASLSGSGMQSFPSGADADSGTVALVLALPKSAFASGSESFTHWVDRVGLRSGDLPTTLAIPLLEVACGASEATVRGRVACFLQRVSVLPKGQWFPAWAVPSLPSSSLQPIDINMAVDLCELRPGDPVLLRSLRDECLRIGCAKAADMFATAADGAVAPSAFAKLPGAIDMQILSVDWLPRPLVALVRARGALPAIAGPTAVELANAVDDFEHNRLEAAERGALVCAGKSVDVEALNLASASMIRNKPCLNHNRAAVALVLAWQAYQLEPGHRFALGNVLLAMRALEMRTEVAALVNSNQCVQPSQWIVGQLDAARVWLTEPPTTVVPFNGSGAPVRPAP